MSKLNAHQQMFHEKQKPRETILATRSKASKRGWVSRKRMASARAASVQDNSDTTVEIQRQSPTPHHAEAE